MKNCVCVVVFYPCTSRNFSTLTLLCSLLSSCQLLHSIGALLIWACSFISPRRRGVPCDTSFEAAIETVSSLMMIFISHVDLFFGGCQCRKWGIFGFYAYVFSSLLMIFCCRETSQHGHLLNLSLATSNMKPSSRVMDTSGVISL